MALGPWPVARPGEEGCAALVCGAGVEKGCGVG